MYRNKNKKTISIFFKIGSVFMLSLTTLVVLVFITAFIANYYIKKNHLLQEENLFLTWKIEDTTYSSKYIYWQNKICPWENCDWEKQKKSSLTQKKYFKNGATDEKECYKLVFLGDSFTISPFSRKGYFDFFSHSFLKQHKCIEVTIIASAGAGTSQELAKFSDDLKKINPDLVIWQFYWNDFFNNVTQSVHNIEDNKLIRKKAWDNSIFWAGFLSQRMPFLQDIDLGKYILAKARKVNLFSSCPKNYYDDDHSFCKIIDYNKIFISTALLEMDKLSETHNFQYYTTLAPLECQFVKKYPCPPNTEDIHYELKQILSTKENYISMEKVEHPVLSEVLGLSTDDLSHLFAQEDKGSPGFRHLSEAGEHYFGDILFYNFNKKTMNNSQ